MLRLLSQAAREDSERILKVFKIWHTIDRKFLMNALMADKEFAQCVAEHKAQKARQ